MADADDLARAAARAQFPPLDAHDFAAWRREAQRDGFKVGAAWQREQPTTVTAEQVVTEYAKHGPDHPFGAVCECGRPCAGWDDHDRHRIFATLEALGIEVTL